MRRRRSHTIEAIFTPIVFIGAVMMMFGILMTLGLPPKLSTALRRALPPQEVADTPPVQPTNGDHPIIGDYPS